MATIITDIEHIPGGYLFWRSLPLKGKRSRVSLSRKWARLFQVNLYPPSLRKAMLLSVLTTDGIPDARSMALYKWLLKYWYNGNAHALHTEWSLLQQMQQTTSAHHPQTIE